MSARRVLYPYKGLQGATLIDMDTFVIRLTLKHAKKQKITNKSSIPRAFSGSSVTDS
jgi:hypothetical protein